MKKCVLTMAAGSYEKLRKVVYPIFENYAKKCNADFHAIEDIKNIKNPVLEKMRIYEYAKKYDRVLFLDADLIVRKDCPNLFDICPIGKFAAYDEGSAMTVAGEVEARANAILSTASLYNMEIPSLPNKFSYFNSGVFMMDSEHAPMFEFSGTMKEEKRVVCLEQNIMNIMLLKKGIPTYHLPVCFNQMPINRTRDYQDCSYIIHYAGYLDVESRINDMLIDLDYWNKNVLS